MNKYITISGTGQHDGDYEVVGRHAGGGAWDETLTLRKLHNKEEHLAWEISEAACDLVYAHRSSPSCIEKARERLIAAIKEFDAS